MVLMGLPGKYFPTVVSFWDWLSPDKIVHFILFASLSFLSAWGYRNYLKKYSHPYKNKLLLTIILLTIAYGGLTEILQKYLFINRYCSIFDFIADAIGCILGVIIYFFISEKKIKKIEESDSNI